VPAKIILKCRRPFADSARPPVDVASSPSHLWHDWVEYRTEALQQQNPHRWLLHLVNYNVQQKIRNIDISIKIPGQVDTITVFDPQNPKEHSLQFDQQDSRIHFILPEMNIYRLIVIN